MSSVEQIEIHPSPSRKEITTQEGEAYQVFSPGFDPEEVVAGSGYHYYTVLRTREGESASRITDAFDIAFTPEEGTLLVTADPEFGYKPVAGKKPTTIFVVYDMSTKKATATMPEGPKLIDDDRDHNYLNQVMDYFRMQQISDFLAAGLSDSPIRSTCIITEADNSSILQVPHGGQEYVVEVGDNQDAILQLRILNGETLSPEATRHILWEATSVIGDIALQEVTP